MIRLFIALEAAPDFPATLWKDLEKLRMAHPEFHWTGREQYHETLRFLGETEAGYVDSLLRSMESAFDSSRSNRIPFVLGNITTFPQRRPASVLALLFTQGEERIKKLERALSAALEQSAREEGIPLKADNGRPFIPHVTVARSGRVPLSLTPEDRNFAIKTRGIFTHLTLFSSNLQKGGPIYKPLGRLPL